MQAQILPGRRLLAPAIPKAAKPLRSNDPFRRDPLASSLMDAVAPVVGSGDDYTLGHGRYEVDVYLALLPVCRAFTVAGAAGAYRSVFPATKSLHHRGTAVDRCARVFIRDVLTAFIAIAAPSSPDDVLALAELLTLTDAYDRHEPAMPPVLRLTAARNLAGGIKDWRRGDFSAGETFGAAGDGSDPGGWVCRVAKETRREEHWFGTKSHKARP